MQVAFLQEVATVQQADLGAGRVLRERHRPLAGEDLIVAAPYRG